MPELSEGLDGLPGKAGRGLVDSAGKGARRLMPEGRYFKEALAGFVSEAAYAGAVRHLYDEGYSVEQIRKNLLYPVSVEQIERVIDDYIRRRNSPDRDYEYIQETDRYGRKSFRRVKKPDAGRGDE